jgi:hypothetical protein
MPEKYSSAALEKSIPQLILKNIPQLLKPVK